MMKQSTKEQKDKEERIRLRRRQEKQERKAMMRSIPGMATLLTQDILKLHQHLLNIPDMKRIFLATIAIDDMVYLTEQFLNTQLHFQQTGRPTTVTIGYHYTNADALNGIRQGGLMSKPERLTNKMGKQKGGAYFGEGIYTGRNPEAFSQYGDTCILVAILEGRSKYVQHGEFSEGFDTVIGNKVTPKDLYYSSPLVDPEYKPFHDEVVLKESGQCLPLLRFSRQDFSYSLFDTPDRNLQNVWKCHEELQAVLDKFLNGGVSVPVTPMYRNTLRSHPTNQFSLQQQAPQFAVPSRAGNPNVATNPNMSGGLSFPTFATGNSSFPMVPPLQPPPPPTPFQPSPLFLNQMASTLPAAAFAAPTTGPGAHQPFTTGSTTGTWRVTASTSSTPFVFGAPPSTTNTTLPPQNTGNSSSPSDNTLGLRNQVERLFPTAIAYTAPKQRGIVDAEPYLKTVKHKSSRDKTCPVCMDNLGAHSSHGVPVCLPCNKNHVFHKNCILQSLQVQPRCPICRVVVGNPQGKSPSGTMSVRVSRKTCVGYENCGWSIVIKYQLHSGRQKPYHDNPGVPFAGTSRTAYLPLCPEGVSLLKRLKYAFEHGLTFTVGTSLTSGRPNSIVWGSIHHKTKRSGGILRHGFPDATFFVNCNDELTAAGVPVAANL